METVFRSPADYHPFDRMGDTSAADPSFHPQAFFAHIEEVLHKQLGLSDLEEVFFKELNLPFLKVFRIISMLGVGAFGVVLEVENLLTLEISALKVRITLNKNAFRS